MKRESVKIGPESDAILSRLKKQYGLSKARLMEMAIDALRRRVANDGPQALFERPNPSPEGT